jgi:dipeptidyl-peptidase 4
MFHSSNVDNRPRGSSCSLDPTTYQRAEAFLPWNAEKRVNRVVGDVKWINDSDDFWYRVQTNSGYEFVYVDSSLGSKELAFDHDKLAASLTEASGKFYEGSHLPFSTISYSEDRTSIEFSINDTIWACDLSTYECTRTEDRKSARIDELESPDGAYIAFVRDHNLWVRDSDTEKETAITTDGEAKYGYAMPVMTPLIDAGLAKPDYFQFQINELLPTAIWSPDSKKILTHRLDERAVGQYHLVQSVPMDGSIRQKHYAFTYPLPGDHEVPQAELVICDIESQSVIRVYSPVLDVLFFGSPLKRIPGKMRSSYAWWSDDGQRVFVLQKERGFTGMSFHAIDAISGESTQIVQETSSTPIDPHLTSAGEPNVRTIDGGKLVLWFSQRSGWGHLYLFDGVSGEIVRQLTSGSWAVADVLHIDETRRMVYFTAVGKELDRDLYEEYLYRVSLEGGEPELLTTEHGTHTIRFSPSGQYFVDICSTLTKPPTTRLMSADGNVVCDLEHAEIDRLLETGWVPPERFTTKARDGQTDIYGVIFRPTNFDPNRKYPVIDNIYAGPQVNQAPVSFGDVSRGRRASNFWQAQAIAELGFIVVMIDGLGMPYRSKAYHDRSYQNLGDGGIPEHVIAIKELANRYPYMDITRVGIFGHSGGGYASCRAMMTFPDFYKVAVSTAGNHDDPTYAAGWTERYMGYPVGDHYFEQSNRVGAENLDGKILLIHGEMDENVHPSCTMVVVDELIKANKDFDFLLMPNRTHACTEDPYFIRKRWDYFVQHLLGLEATHEYRISEDPNESHKVFQFGS